MNNQKPLIVFVFSKEGTIGSTRYDGFAKRLEKTGDFNDYNLLTVALENLIFIVREDKSADVIDPISGHSLSGADLVYFKSWSQCLGEACALAHFLKSRGVPFMDSRVLGVGDSKISTVMKMWAAEIRVPLTVYSHSKKHLIKYVLDNQIFSSEKFIVKDVHGSKGQNNFLISAENLKKVLVYENPDINFMAQRYISNQGDYRIGVYGSKASFVIHRKTSGKSHLNNTSAGGTATFIPVKNISRRLVKIARQAAEASELQVAGVDIIVDKLTKKAYILEVNQGSQIVTGVFVDKNIQAFNKAVIAQAKKRLAKSRQQPLTIIGRRARVKLPNLGIVDAVAKVDSGAYTSTLHAHNIRVEDDKLVFELRQSDGYITNDSKTKVIHTSDYFIQKVRRSTGKIELRYSIRTKLTIAGKTVKATLTLSDRSYMGYPLLIGRRIIRSRFLINVELDEENHKVWKF